MTEPTPAAGDRGDGLLTGPVRTESGWSAGLAVPQGHPFFFDHPLDHLSGALTICGLLDLADAVAGPAAAADRLLLDLRFPAMGTLTDPTELSIAAEPGTPRRWSLAAHQADVEICGGTCQRITGIGRTGTLRPPALREVLCPQDLVHRADEENVVLGVPENGAEAVTAPVVPAGPGHYLDRGTAFSAAGLIESSRQFFTVLEHWAAGWPHGTKMFWMRFRADLPAVPTSPAYSFRWVREPVKGSRLTAAFDLLDADGGVAGRFEYVSVNVSPAAYERFRAARTRLAGGAAA